MCGDANCVSLDELCFGCCFRLLRLQISARDFGAMLALAVNMRLARSASSVLRQHRIANLQNDWQETRRSALSTLNTNDEARFRGSLLF